MYYLWVSQTEEKLKHCYQSRRETLRRPLHQLKGSERDTRDAMTHRQMVVDEQDNLVAVGRLHINADSGMSIRFVAVHPDVQDKGLGTLMTMTLELVVCQKNVKRVICGAHEDTMKSFVKPGFVNQDKITTSTTTSIRHFLMIRPVATLGDILHRGDWCAQLQQIWYKRIPLSGETSVYIQQYIGQKFIITMSETGDQNSHHTLFAGSLLSLATLIGWGFIWLMLCERHLGGAIIPADVHIRYSKPISGKPRAVVDLGALSDDLDRLARRRKAWVQMQVEIFSGETPSAVLENTCIVLPAKPFGLYGKSGDEEEQGRFTRQKRSSIWKPLLGPGPELSSRSPGDIPQRRLRSLTDTT